MELWNADSPGGPDPGLDTARQSYLSSEQEESLKTVMHFQDGRKERGCLRSKEKPAMKAVWRDSSGLFGSRRGKWRGKAGFKR